MNIFVLDLNTTKCAEYHVNSHVTKMIVEYCQLLCGVHWILGSEAPYKLTHKNHPCALWTRESLDNYIWLCDLGFELCKEYTHRYGKRHKTQDVIEWCFMNEPNLPNNGYITKFALAMPEYCKMNNTIDSYRRYYKLEKNNIAFWKNRETPEWFKN